MQNIPSSPFRGERRGGLLIMSIIHYPISTLLAFTLMTSAMTLTSCGPKSAASRAEEALPQAPDYADAGQWHAIDRGASADIFYVISTETGDYPLPDGTACHYADTYADSLRQPMLAEMEGVDELLSGSLNFYSPYYRQCSLQSFASDSLAAQRLPLPLSDVRRAFAHYMSHQNQGRPFILAGFSQGALLAEQLLADMADSTFSRLVAAYLIGISITPETLADNNRLRPAQRADDTGVTICYNSVRDTACALWPRSAVAINPVNWRTDSVSATYATEPTPLLPIDRQHKDTLTVRLDTVTNLLLVSGYSATDYVLPLIGRDGNYHSREIWLYRQQLRQNIELRADAYLRQRQSHRQPAQ